MLQQVSDFSELLKSIWENGGTPPSTPWKLSRKAGPTADINYRTPSSPPTTSASDEKNKNRIRIGRGTRLHRPHFRGGVPNIRHDISRCKIWGDPKGLISRDPERTDFHD